MLHAWYNLFTRFVSRQLLVRHHSVYYAVRMDLVQHMISSMQRLGFTQSATIEHRKLAVDLAEVIIEWEKRRFAYVFFMIDFFVRLSKLREPSF